MSDEKTTANSLDHLGAVLLFIAELSPSDRCDAIDNALAFYNAVRPEAQIQPQPGYITKLVQIGPLDWPVCRENRND